MSLIPGTTTCTMLEFGQSRIPYVWGFGIAEKIVQVAAALDADRFIIVTDQRVSALYGKQYEDALKNLAPVSVVTMATGEEHKNWSNLQKLCEAFIEFGATRRTCIVALGGGVIGNLAGLSAALTFRGLRLIHVPTTLVAAFDSVISLKQAINSRAGKNHFGAYLEPSFIFADFSTFSTLDERDILSGIGELIKNALAIRPADYNGLAVRISPAKRLSPESLNWFLQMSVASKLELMAGDPRERRTGIILEYGHTVGHAVEFLDICNRGTQSLSHGEAVGLGALVASIVAVDVVGANSSLVERHQYLLEAAGISASLPRSLSADDIVNCVFRDNKRGYVKSSREEVPMVLLKRVGTPCWNGDVPLTLVGAKSLGRALRSVAGCADR